LLLVTHGGALRAFLCWVVMADLRAIRRIEADNCALTVVDLLDNGPRLIGWNDTAHLHGLLDPTAGSPRVE
jgi:broad specificity phosphatase PhoE